MKKLDESQNELLLLEETRKLSEEESASLREQLQSTIENSAESAQMARETIESLSQLIREKDNEIEALKLSVLKSEELTALKSEKEELVKLVQLKHNESLQYHSELQKLTVLLNEQAVSAQKLVQEKENDVAAIKDKEAQILWAQNELQVVRQRLKNFEESDNFGEKCGIVEHSSLTGQLAIANEKSNALEAALVQEQTSNRILHDQLNESLAKEQNVTKELERLRSHLLDIEASYTEEALSREESYKELEAKLKEAEEKAKNSSSIYTSASIRANQQVETMQQQMALIMQQRDDVQRKLSSADDKAMSCTASVTNLQLVLEQFQRGKILFFLLAEDSKGLPYTWFHVSR